jgi:hypothetical protein
MIDKCLCPPPSELPADVSSDSWAKYCSNIAKFNSCRAGYTNISRVGGVFIGRKTVGHLAGNALDANAGPHTIPCNTVADEKVQQSIGVVNVPKDYPLDGNFCVSKSQQQLIKAMLKNGFCVALSSASKNLREAWHFELTTNGIPLSSFCTKDLSDPNLQKLYYLQN